MVRLILISVSLPIVVAVATVPWSSPRPLPVVSHTETSFHRDTDRIFLQHDQVTLSRRNGHAILSILNLKEPLKHGDFVWNAENVDEGKVWVRIDLERQLISVFRSGHEIGTAVILYGTEHKATPRGQFPILGKVVDNRSSLYGAEMPYTLRLTTDGVAIHGSDVRWGAATHGCIGVPNAFAAELFAALQLGDEVVIL